jgi:hypothetical protein
VAELPLDVALIDLCSGSQAGPQRMSGELLASLGFGEIAADAGAGTAGRPIRRRPFSPKI